MLTLRGIYKDGNITFLDDPPEGIECEVQVTFVNTADTFIKFPGKGKEPTLFVSVHDPKIWLTEHELDVLTLASFGLQVREIAEKLDCNYSRASKAFFDIYLKFGVHGKAQALFKAEKLGFLQTLKVGEVMQADFGVSDGDYDFNQREKDVLQLAYAGLKRAEIAEKLRIPSTWVDDSFRILFRRLPARNRTEAVRKGIELGLIVRVVNK